MKSRIIFHIDMDAFFAAVEERENPQFRGKPIVVGADPKGGRGRGVVSSASYSARKYRIHSAMPISKAYKLCPKAIFLPVNMKLYKEVSERVMRTIKKYSEKWEIVSLDETYLDISFVKSYKKAENLAKKLKKEISEKEKLTSTVGIGPNKLIAKMACQKAKPDGLLIIKPKQVKSFLDPLDIEELPGIGSKTAEKLGKLGVSKIKEFKRLSKVELRDMFGKVGADFYKKARGIEESEVSPRKVVKSIGKEHTFEENTRDPKLIFETFEKLIQKVHKRLLVNNFSFKTITVICRFSGFETHTKSKTLKKKTCDFEILKARAKKLLLKFLVENPKLIRLIGLRVSGLT